MRTNSPVKSLFASPDIAELARTSIFNNIPGNSGVLYIKNTSNELDIKTYIKNFIFLNGSDKFVKIIKNPDEEFINLVYQYEYQIKKYVLTSKMDKIEE